MASPVSKSAVDIGTLLAETYEVVGLLGRGGMGTVWMANHVRLPGKQVAIKLLHADIADEESLARFRREAEIASRLGHPNIVDVHDFNALPDGTPYLVLEYLDGESLDERISRGPMALDDVFTIIRQIGSALQAAHAEQIIHRDLKPQNVFLVPTEAGGYLAEHAKVLDFGISKIRGSATVKTQDSAILGTPQYMAPEQATGNHDAVDPRTDVFALGAMTYEMLCGKPAFAGQTIPEVVFKVVYEEPPNLGEVNPSVTPRVVRAVHKALAKKQEERFQDVSEFVKALTGNALTTLRRGTPVAAPSTTGRQLGVASTNASESAPAQDPYAKTIGSGDHSAQLAAAKPYAATVTPAGLTGSGVAPRAPRTWLWGVLALVSIAAAVGITILAMRGGGDPKSSGDELAANEDLTERQPASDVLPAAVDAGAALTTDPTTGSTPDASADSKSDPATDTKTDAKKDTKKDTKTDTKKDAKDDTKKDTKTDAKDDEPTTGEPAEFLELIKQGEQALAAGDGSKALHLAEKAMRVHPGQAAFALRAKAYCLKKDLSNVNASVRRLNAAWMRRVKRFCDKVGMEL